MVAILWHLHLGKFQGNKIHSDERREANLPADVVIPRESCQNSSTLGGDLGPVNTFGAHDQGQSQRRDIQFVIHLERHTIRNTSVPLTYKNYSMHKVTFMVTPTGCKGYVPHPPPRAPFIFFLKKPSIHRPSLTEQRLLIF